MQREVATPAIEGSAEFPHQRIDVGHVGSRHVEDHPTDALQRAQSSSIIGELSRIDVPLSVVLNREFQTRPCEINTRNKFAVGHHAILRRRPRQTRLMNMHSERRLGR